MEIRQDVDVNMKKTEKGIVLRIERASIYDGEGIQTVVFLKGCPLRCAWCSTPESQKLQPETTAKGKTYGRVMDVDELMREIEKDEVFFFHSGGGVTISGGEALVQAQFAAEVFRRCHALGINTTLESSLFADFNEIELLLPDLDLLYADIKHMDSEAHKKLTGVDNECILANMKAVSSHKDALRLIVRMPVIPSVNDDEENLKSLARFCSELPTLKKIELLPYHRLGVNVYEELGLEYTLKEIKAPSREYMEEKVRVIHSVAPGLDVVIR